jgi:hypothetical protein
MKASYVGTQPDTNDVVDNDDTATNTNTNTDASRTTAPTTTITLKSMTQRYHYRMPITRSTGSSCCSITLLLSISFALLSWSSLAQTSSPNTPTDRNLSGWEGIIHPDREDPDMVNVVVTIKSPPPQQPQQQYNNNYLRTGGGVGIDVVGGSTATTASSSSSSSSEPPEPFVPQPWVKEHYAGAKYRSQLSHGRIGNAQSIGISTATSTIASHLQL